MPTSTFNARFWYEEGGYLYDVIDGEQGDDSALRPNQIFAISLEHPVLDRSRWRPVFEIVRDRLLTPVGLRSLAPGHRDFKAQYYGDLRARDAAYHQGTVWAWLAGPFVDVWLKINPADKAGARAACLEGFVPHLNDAGSARSARFSTPSRLTSLADASLRPGAWPKCCARGCARKNGSRRPLGLRKIYLALICSNASPSSFNSSPYVAQSPRRCASTARS